jgi:hypothetical protein
MRYARAWAAVLAAGVVLGGTGAVTAGAAAAPVRAGGAAVVISCQNKAEVRPGQFILTCADGNDYLTGLAWASWRSLAFGTGTEYVNDCLPNCAEGHFHRYPVLVDLWRAQRRPGHPGERYFSRLTEVYTGPRPTHYTGHRKYYPPTFTWDLWSQLG